MHFAALPPEVNSGRMYAGPGPGPLLAAASAWDELADELHTTAADYGSVVSGLTSEAWQGVSSEEMAASAAPQMEWLRATAGQASQAGAQAKAAASAYESAYSMTVPPATVATNRAQLLTLQATNLLGQNAGAIAANEVAYAEMWAQDVAAMYGYAGAARTASQVTPFAEPQQTTDQNGVAGQTAAAGQAAGTSAGNAQALMSEVPSALQSLESSSGLTGFDEFSNVYNLASLGSGLLGNGVGLIGLSGAAGFITKTEDKITGDLFGADEPQRPAAPKPPPVRASKASAVSAEMGEAGSLGRLSVPQGWTTAAPQVRLAAMQAPIASAAANTPGLLSDMPLLGQAPLMAMPGRGSTPSDRNATPARPAVVATTAETATEASPVAPAAQMREITDVLGKLADLKDKGALTDQEFNEQKQRLLGGR